ncbi:hypothetical protein [Streptomyces sp. NPDC059994]|uniref:hypothetical protein n=1 Tax=Streptomyces sp. NPDC059994 TaxID=3347029 RepID=UPI00368308FA
MAALAISGCSSSGEHTDSSAPTSKTSAPPSNSSTPQTPPPSRSGTAGTAPTWTPPASDPYRAWQAKPKGPIAPDAQDIHAKSVPLLNNTEATYGSESGSKCWPARASALTSACTTATGKAEQTAQRALSWIKHEPATYFTTLRTNANHILAAAGHYRTDRCADSPAAAPVRTRCQASAYAIAQAYPYLRGGFNAALEGR